MDKMKELIRKFYIKNYPDDDYYGPMISDSLTFEDLYNRMKSGEDFYEIAGGHIDSLVRERIFDELAKRLNVDYDVIYDLWLGRTTECYKESFEYLSDEDQKKEAKNILRKYVSFDEVKNGEEDLSYVKDQLQSLMAEGHIETDAYKYIIENFDSLSRSFLVTDDTVLEYDNDSAKEFKDIFDIADEQDCADTFGKTVVNKRTHKRYYPKKNEYIKESSDREVLSKVGSYEIIKDGYGFGIDNGTTVNRFFVDNDGIPHFDYEPTNRMLRKAIDKLVKSGKLDNPNYKGDDAKFVGNTLKYGRGVKESKKVNESLHEGDYFEYGDLSFELLYMDEDDNDNLEYAIICDQVENAVGMEDVIGFVEKDATKEDVMKVIKDNYDDFYRNAKTLDNYKPMNDFIKVNKETENKAILDILGVTDNETLTQEDKDSYIRQFHELEEKGYDPASIWLKSDYGTYINTKIVDETEDLVTVEYPTSEEVKEGISDKMTPEEIAKKHNVSIEEINKQLEKGIEVEKEHTDDEKKAERIALDHLFEIPDYYDRLDKMENGAKMNESFVKEMPYDNLDEYESSLADYIYKEYVETGKYGPELVKEVTLKEIRDEFDDRITRKQFNKVIKLIKDVIDRGDLKYYNGSIQLDDSHNMFEVNVDIDDGDYWFIVDNYLEGFDEAHDVTTSYDGRSFRHVIVDDNARNFINYPKMKEDYDKLRSDFIDYINSEEWKGVDESLKEDNLKEDTIKTKSGKWTNKGKEGTHGTFKTKKEADAQRKAMFSQGYQAEAQKEAQEWFDPYNGFADELDEEVNESAEYGFEDISVVVRSTTEDGNDVFVDQIFFDTTKEAKDFARSVNSGENGTYVNCYAKVIRDVDIDESIKESADNKTYEVEKWWEDVQDWNVRNGSPFTIDNGDPSDEDYFDSMVDAMFDMVRDIKDKDKELYRRGKKLYNKYAKYSKITEGVEEKEGKYVYVLTDGKDHIIEQFDSYEDAIEYAKNSEITEFVEEAYLDEDGWIDWDSAEVVWTRDSLDEAFIAKDENFKEIKRLCDEIGIKTLSELDYFKKEQGLDDDCDSNCLIDALKKYRAELGDDFKLESINIRESLNKIDNITYNQFDLRNLYDSQILSEDKKIEVAKLIRENANAEKIYNCLMEGIINEEDVDIRTIERDETRTGNAFFHREPNTLEEIKTAKERHLEIDPDAIGDDYRVIKTVTLDKNVDGIRELNRLTKENVDENTSFNGTSYYDKNVIEFKTPEGRWLVDPMNYDYAVYAAFVDEE